MQNPDNEVLRRIEKLEGEIERLRVCQKEMNDAFFKVPKMQSRSVYDQLCDALVAMSTLHKAMTAVRWTMAFLVLLGASVAAWVNIRGGK